MGKNPSYPSHRHKISSSNSSSSGKPRVKHSRIERDKSNTTTYANNGSVQNFDSIVDNCIRSSHANLQKAISYRWGIENDMRTTGLAYSRLSTFPSVVNNYIRSSHRSAGYSRISNSYPSYGSMVDNYTRTVVSSVSGSSLGTAPGWSSRLDSHIRSGYRISSSHGYY